MDRRRLPPGPKRSCAALQQSSNTSGISGISRHDQSHCPRTNWKQCRNCSLHGLCPSCTGPRRTRLHGKLVHLSSVFPLIRPFLPSASRFAASFPSPHARRFAPNALSADLDWIHDLLLVLPRSLLLACPEPFDLSWWGDTSSSFGIGVVVRGYWSVWKYPPGVKVGPGHPRNIGWAEGIAVKLRLVIAHNRAVLMHLPADHARILVRSDNSGVVAVVNKGRSRSSNTNSVLKHTYSWLAGLGISLHAEYVPSRDSVMDALSRGDIPAFLTGFPGAVSRVHIDLPPLLLPLLVPFL
jgi:hypothetical protein